MAIDLRAFIEDDKAIKLGGFAGSVFLTYTLSLNFFEQIIEPALAQAGCANALIISDPGGYAEAMRMGNKNINGVGMRYVCEPLHRANKGFQHAKVFFMAGQHFGRLLIGSGNLTYHGYGRNLELYSGFEFNDHEPDNASLYAFHETWDLIQKIRAKRIFSPPALDRIRIIEEKATWLTQPVAPVDGFRVWHNFDRSIWSQFHQWRDEMGLSTNSAKKIFIISPFFDKDLGTAQKIATDLNPYKVEVVVDPGSTNLNGQKLQNCLQNFTPHLMGIKNRILENQSTQKRPLHAKAIVGIEKDSSWCITGSANITRPALLESWNSSGNLEMVTFRWSNDKDAFDYLLTDPSIQTWQMDINSMDGTFDSPSDQPRQITTNFYLEYVNLRGFDLVGKVNLESHQNFEIVTINFLRRESPVQTTLNLNGQFSYTLPTQLNESEAIQLELNEIKTPYRWIDQQDILDRFGARSYHDRIQRKIETFEGAGRLFEELLNFLWERTNLEQIQEQPGAQNPFRRNRADHNNSDDQNVPPAPPASEFILSENDLLEKLNKRVGHQLPYDRSTWSLRDLLSLVLLRLTTPIQASDKISEFDKDDDNGQNVDLDKEQREAISRKRLRDFVVQYCRRYGTRLVDNEFIQRISPLIIFENHFTLGRVLMELVSKGEQFPEFTLQDFRDCTWWLWAPLVWPSILGLGGKSSFDLLSDRTTVEELRTYWDEKDLSSLLVLMMNRAFGKPPAWKEGIRNTKLASMNLAIKQFVLRIESILQIHKLDLTLYGISEALGIHSASELANTQTFIPNSKLQALGDYLDSIRRYRSPVEERLSPIISVFIEKIVDKSKIEALQFAAREYGIESEFKLYLQNPKKVVAISTIADDEGEVYCVCGGSLTKEAVDRLKRGDLVLCPSFKDAWLYQSIPIPQKILGT